VRPEIIDLISFLNGMGAKIRVFGQEHIEVVGVEGLRETEHTVIPDNMEAITWLVAAVMTRGDVEIKKFPYRDLEVPLIHLRKVEPNFSTVMTLLLPEEAAATLWISALDLFLELTRMSSRYWLLTRPALMANPE